MMILVDFFTIFCTIFFCFITKLMVAISRRISQQLIISIKSIPTIKAGEMRW